jgi:L-ascorbate metabolism protein UlaG (beta-lactamase superfamily)
MPNRSWSPSTSWIWNSAKNNKMKSETKVIYLGGPTVIIEIAGLRLITDPTLDPPGIFPAGPGDSIEKLSGPALSDIGKIDVVLLSHDQHADNLDKAGKELVMRTPLTLSTKVAASRLGGNVIGISPWETYKIPTPDGGHLTVTATPARHGPAGIEGFAGDVTGFMLTLGSGDDAIYLTGDTVFYEGIKEVAARFNPKFVFIFSGAAKPKLPIHLTMDVNDALDTASAFPAATFIPVHYEGWSHLTETVNMLRQAFTALGLGERLKILEAGKPFVLA